MPKFLHNLFHKIRLILVFLKFPILFIALTNHRSTVICHLKALKKLKLEEWVSHYFMEINISQHLNTCLPFVCLNVKKMFWTKIVPGIRKLFYLKRCLHWDIEGFPQFKWDLPWRKFYVWWDLLDSWNKDCYCTTLQWATVSFEWHVSGQRSRLTMLLHDTVHLHFLNMVEQRTIAQRWEVLPHAACIPDLSLSDSCFAPWNTL